MKICVYVEGGGKGHRGRQLRTGFRKLFEEQSRQAPRKLQFITSGSRESTFEDFCTALRTSPSDFNVLLVDSEGPVGSRPPWTHPHVQDSWAKPQGVDDSQCHLMVQAMEAWILADRQALKDFYGNGFNENALPNHPNVEDIPKEQLMSALRRATRNVEKKGEYHKTRHAPLLLQKIRLAAIRQRAPSCDRFAQVVEAKIKSLP